MKVTEIAFVCYAVKNLKRARAFYEGVLGLKPGSVWEGEKMGFIEYEIGSHTLAIGCGASNFKPSKFGATAALEVENFKEAIVVLEKNKSKFILKAHETPICFMALVEDQDKNRIMIHKRKKK